MRCLSGTTASLLVTVLGLTACGHARETDPDLDGTAALDCLAERADGALSDRDREILSVGFKFDAVNAQVSARSADDPTEGATDYFADPDLDEQDDGEAAPFVPQTMSAFDSLQLERDDAEAVYAAATECGTDFPAMMSRQALAAMPSALADTPEAAACVKKAVTEETVAEYVIAVLGKSEPSEYGSQFGLWRTLHACTPRTTLATAPDTGPAEEPDPQDNNGYFDNDNDDDNATSNPGVTTGGDGKSDIQACLDYVDEQAIEIVEMLNQGLIAEADYERLMAENSDQSRNCLDLR